MLLIDEMPEEQGGPRKTTKPTSPATETGRGETVRLLKTRARGRGGSELTGMSLSLGTVLGKPGPSGCLVDAEISSSHRGTPDRAVGVVLYFTRWCKPGCQPDSPLLVPVMGCSVDMSHKSKTSMYSDV